MLYRALTEECAHHSPTVTDVLTEISRDPHRILLTESSQKHHIITQNPCSIHTVSYQQPAENPLHPDAARRLSRMRTGIRRAASTLVGRRSTACGSRIPQGSRSRAARWGSASIASAMFLAKQTLTLSGSEKIQDRFSRDLLPPRDWFCVNYRVCLLQNSKSTSHAGI